LISASLTASRRCSTASTMRSDNWGGKYSDWQGLKNLFQKAGDLFPAFYFLPERFNSNRENSAYFFLEIFE